MARAEARLNANLAYQAYLQAIRDDDDEAYYKAIRDGALITGVEDDVLEDQWPHVEPYEAEGETYGLPFQDAFLCVD